MFMAKAKVTEAYQRLQALLLQRSVYEWQAVTRQAFVQDHASHGRIDHPVLVFTYCCTHHILCVVFECQIDKIALPSEPNVALRLDDTGVESKQHIVN